MDGTAGAGWTFLCLSLCRVLCMIGLDFLKAWWSELSDSLHGSWQIPRCLGRSFKASYNLFLFQNITCYILLVKQVTTAIPDPRGGKSDSTYQWRDLANSFWLFLIDHTSHIAQSPSSPRLFEALFNLLPALSPIPSPSNLLLVVLLFVSQIYQLSSYLGPLPLLFPLPDVLCPQIIE